MKDELISFDTAKLAKEKGFDLKCSNGYYETLAHTLDCGRGDIIDFPYQAPRILTQPAFGIKDENVFLAQAPTQSLLQKWLREAHNISIVVNTNYNISKDTLSYSVIGFKMKHNHYGLTFSKRDFITYEEALEVGLKEALKLIK